MYHYLTFMRDIFVYQQDPSSATILACALWGVGMLAVGYLVFHKFEHKFILYI